MTQTETKYAKMFPLNSRVRYNSEWRKRCTNDGIGQVVGIKFRNGMVPAITVADDNGVILYGILAEHLESVPTIAVEL